MRVCLTGALGHIGAAYLSQSRASDDILAIDNLSSNHHSVLFKQSLSRSIRFVQDDILYADLDELLRDCDVVIHLAAITDAAHSYANKEDVESVNFLGAKRVGLACARAGAKMLFPSSTSVYGVSGDEVDEESMVRPQSPYAWSKINAERALLAIPNLRVSILRFGTIYGGSLGMRMHTFVNQACWNAVCGKPIEVWSSAWDQYRPYLWIGDAINAIHHVVRCDLFNGQVYNVLTDNHSVSEVIAQIKKYRPYSKIQMVDSPIMNQLSYRTSCRKFENTGWKSAGRLDEGIKSELELFSMVN